MSGLTSTAVARVHWIDQVGARNLRIAGVVGFSGLTALAAQITVPFPPFDIPATLQTLAVGLCALTLGPRLGMLSMGLYVLMGAIGVPVFADAGAGWTHLYGQTAGYLLGFVIAQSVIGSLSRTKMGSRGGPLSVMLSLLCGYAVIYVLGVTWLKLVGDLTAGGAISWAAAWFGGCAIFLPGMLAKVGLATIFGPALVRFGRRIGC